MDNSNNATSKYTDQGFYRTWKLETYVIYVLLK